MNNMNMGNNMNNNINSNMNSNMNNNNLIKQNSKILDSFGE